MVNKLTHNSGTTIDYVYVLQTVNAMQTNVTDCYYNDDDCILCLITVELTYITFSWNSGIYMINMILCIQMLVKYCLNMMMKKYFWRIQKYTYCRKWFLNHINEMPPHGGRELIWHAILLHPLLMRNIHRQKICDNINMKIDIATSNCRYV